ncbi:MAG: hypothetical protein NTY87_01755 [Planctomycetia bacterium]|nr:hypothetical protein [Planctomycetia bacterium]
MAREDIVQDNRRETQIARIVGLKPSEKRAGRDATDLHSNSFELKSATKKGVTTARDVGVQTIAKWRKTYWVVATGLIKAGKFKIDSIYVAHPDDLEPWFAQLEKTLLEEERVCDKVLKAAAKAGAAKDDILFVRKKCERGITRNNPKIPLRRFQDHCFKLDHTNSKAAQKQLAEFVRNHPLN